MSIDPGVLVPLDEERVVARDDEPGRGVAREIVVEREGFACVVVANGRFGSDASELEGHGAAPDHSAFQDLIKMTEGTDEKGNSIPVRAIADRIPVARAVALGLRAAGGEARSGESGHLDGARRLRQHRRGATGKDGGKQADDYQRLIDGAQQPCRRPRRGSVLSHACRHHRSARVRPS